MHNVEDFVRALQAVNTALRERLIPQATAAIAEASIWDYARRRGFYAELARALGSSGGDRVQA